MYLLQQMCLSDLSTKSETSCKLTQWGRNAPGLCTMGVIWNAERQPQSRVSCQEVESGRYYCASGVRCSVDGEQHGSLGFFTSSQMQLPVIKGVMQRGLLSACTLTLTCATVCVDR